MPLLSLRSSGEDPPPADSSGDEQGRADAPHLGQTWKMAKRILEREIWVPASLEGVFEFFSDVRNLEKLTPATLQFHILTPMPLEMRAGTLIDYKLKLMGLPMRWRSEITVWEPPHRFTDFQLKGPYKLWDHEHSFREERGGTVVSDRVEYEVAGWILEPVIHALLVAPQLERIFDYRTKVIQEVFG